ncbi:hypothetical protein [Arcticibacter eurypsychrophilus]|uniref:hypothetical protein n=1 Tax=Arcticibacter eurypsychrophilus TaxID=1434752 RepID=UPI00084D5D2E|nr:hypothetical protein [Arcticibacter eurypsychrophilus]
MKINPNSRKLTILILSGILIFGCKKDTNQSSVESVATTSEHSLSLSAVAAPSPLTYRNTFYNTDYLSVGVGGFKHTGSGSIEILGNFPLSSVTKVYLYWHGESPVVEEVGKTVKLNGTTVTGTNIGITGPNNGLDNGTSKEINSQAYRADVTAIVKSSATREFAVSEFGRLVADGASFVLFYSDGISSNNRDIVLFDGNDSKKGFAGYPGNPKAPFDPAGWDFSLSGVNYTSGKVLVTMHVADGQSINEGDGPFFLNSQEIFSRWDANGSTVEGANTLFSARWDIIPTDITPWLQPGVNSLRVTINQLPNQDLLGLVVALFNLPKGAAPVNTIPVSFDYRPLNCPNTLRTSSGAEEAAILGSSTFNVNQVDLSSVKLNGIPFKKSRVIDKSAPFNGTVSSCSTCSTLAPDGIKDLEFLFDSQLLLKTLGMVKDKQCIKVTLTGKLLPQYGSTPIKGEDYILISK